MLVPHLFYQKLSKHFAHDCSTCITSDKDSYIKVLERGWIWACKVYN